MALVLRYESLPAPSIPIVAIELTCAACDGTGSLSDDELQRLCTLVTAKLGKHPSVAALRASTSATHTQPSQILPSSLTSSRNADPVASTSQQPIKEKKTRTTTGCDTCRQRRVKCDEKKPICGGCTKRRDRVCKYTLSMQQPASRQRKNKRALSQMGSDGVKEGEGSKERSNSATTEGSLGRLTTTPWPWGINFYDARSDMFGLIPLPNALNDNSEDLSMNFAELSPPIAPSSLLHSIQQVDGYPHHVLPDSLNLVSVTSSFPPLSPISELGRVSPNPPSAAVGLYFQHAVKTISSHSLGGSRPNKGVTTRTRTLQLLWNAYYVNDGPVAKMLLYSAICFGACHLGYFSKREGEAADAQEAASSFREAALRSRDDIPIEGGVGTQDEIVLAACFFLQSHDILSVRSDWRGPRSWMLQYIARRGGPEGILTASQADGTDIFPQLQLANLAAFEVMTCLIFDEPPQLLEPSKSSLWLERVPASGVVVEEVLGFGLPLLFAAIDLCTILAELKKPDSNRTQLSNSAQALFGALDTIHLATIYAGSSTLRVQAGNLIFRHTLMLQILVRVFGLGADHPRVERSAKAILELLIEVTCTTGLASCLMFPVLVAAPLCAIDTRPTFLLLIEHMKHAVGCFDIAEGERVIQETWRRQDAGQKSCSALQIMQSEKEYDHFFL